MTTIVKICSQCKIPKDTTEFYWRDKKKGTLQSVCKKCVISNTTKYNADNKERVAKQRKKYRKKNKEKIKKYNHEYWKKYKVKTVF